MKQREREREAVSLIVSSTPPLCCVRAYGVEPAARDPSSDPRQIPHAVAAREEAASAIQCVPIRLSRKVGLREV